MGFGGSVASVVIVLLLEQDIMLAMLVELQVEHTCLTILKNCGGYHQHLLLSTHLILVAQWTLQVVH